MTDWAADVSPTMSTRYSVPAALEAAGRFFESRLLDSYLQAADRELFSHAKAMAATWRNLAGPLFDVSMPSATARRDISDYAAALKIPDRAALSSRRFRGLFSGARVDR